MEEIFEIVFGTWWGITIFVVVCLALWIVLSSVLYRQFFKRFYDILLSGCALLVLSPIYLVVAILVRTKLGSPIIFKQCRPGKNNKIFVMHKFRTMTNEKDKNGELLPDEMRLPKFGKWLRSTSMDELPEIWDIFCGKMSIIGPRPQLVKDLVFMDEETKKRHSVRGGLTGLAQVNGRNNISWQEKFDFDLEYVNSLNIWLDMKIFFKTIFRVFKREDVATDGMETAMDYGDCLLRDLAITTDEYNRGQNQAKSLISSMVNSER